MKRYIDGLKFGMVDMHIHTLHSDGDQTLKEVLKIGFIDELRKEQELDGIECFHPSAESDNKIDILIEYAKTNKLFISGGSDFHGDKKPNIQIGKGLGSLKIPKEYIEEWRSI